MVASRHEHFGRSRPAGITMAPQASPPTGRGRRGVGGAETPTPASTRGGCSAAGRLATCPRRSRHPSLAGTWADAFVADLADLDVTEATRQGPMARHGELVSGEAEIQLPTFGLVGLRQPCQAWVQSWRACGSIASPARPASGGRGRTARGPHRGCSWPDPGGRPDQHGGGGAGAGRWSGAGREPAQ